MELSVLKSKILSRMDEVVSSIGGSIPDHYSMDDFIPEGINEVFKYAPAYLLPTSSIQNTPTRNSDGSGYVELPGDCFRLEYFKMTGWNRPAKIIDVNDPLYRIQANSNLRGDINYPVAVICPQGDTLPILEYYSLPTTTTTHTIEKSVYIRRITLNEVDILDEKLSEALAWAVASFILSIGNEVNAGNYARARFSEIMNAVGYINVNQPLSSNVK